MYELDEIELLKRRADSLGLYINEHRSFDPCRGGGPFYVQRKRKGLGEACPSLLKYATAEQCWDFFERYAKQ